MSANIIVNKQLTGNLCLSVTNHDASLVLNATGDYNAYLVEVPISRATCMQNDELSSISIPNHHQRKWCRNFPPTLLIDIYPPVHNRHSPFTATAFLILIWPRSVSLTLRPSCLSSSQWGLSVVWTYLSLAQVFLLSFTNPVSSIKCSTFIHRELWPRWPRCISGGSSDFMCNM